MTGIYTRKYKGGYRVYFRLKDRHGMWHSVNTGIQLDKIFVRNGKTVWPRRVLDLKMKLDWEKTTNTFGAAQTVSRRDATISEVLKAFSESSTNKRKPSTLKLYEFAVRKFISTLGDMKASDITHREMYMFRDTMIKKHGRVNTKQYFTHLNGLFNWAADPEEDFIERNPISKSVKFTVKMPQRPGFTASEIRRIFRKALQDGDVGLKHQLEFLLLTGFRVNESCTYRLDQFNFENKVIHHRNEKGGEEYPYPMHRKLERFLKRLPQMYTPYAFKYRSKHTVANYLKRIIRELEYSEKLTTHSLKVTYVNRLKEMGLNAAEIHLLAHHKSFQTTMIYVRQDVNHLRKLMDKM
jgi:integrase